MPADRTAYERSNAKAYLFEFLPAMVAYSVILVAVIVLVDFDTAGSWKYVVALLPIIPALFGARAAARHYSRIDELDRVITSGGWATGFAVAMITALTIGFLGMAGLDTGKGGPWIVYSLGMLGWIVGAAITQRRFR